MFIPLGSFCSDEQSVKPRVVQCLIFVNLSVCVYQLCLYYDDISFMMRHGAVPRDIVSVIDAIPFFFFFFPNLLHPSLITSLFLPDARVMEGGLIHIIGNMLYLSAFGPNLEARIGHFRFFILYFFSGVTATLLYVLVHYDSTIPLIGASGAVAGVMGAHFVACRRSRIRCLCLIFIRSLPASVVLLPWIVIQVVNISLSYHGSPVAWLAHIGGFGMGIFCIKKLLRFPLQVQPRSNRRTVPQQRSDWTTQTPLLSPVRRRK